MEAWATFYPEGKPHGGFWTSSRPQEGTGCVGHEKVERTKGRVKGSG